MVKGGDALLVGWWVVQVDLLTRQVQFWIAVLTPDITGRQLFSFLFGHFFLADRILYMCVYIYMWVADYQDLRENPSAIGNVVSERVEKIRWIRYLNIWAAACT